eukprot:1963299-Rhodomonas_salina.2
MQVDLFQPVDHRLNARCVRAGARHVSPAARYARPRARCVSTGHRLLQLVGNRLIHVISVPLPVISVPSICGFSSRRVETCLRASPARFLRRP